MEQVLVVVHTEADGTLNQPSLEAVGAAVRVGEELGGARLAIGAVGEAAAAAHDRHASCGATRFLAVSDTQCAPSRYGSDAAAVEALCRAAGATLVIAPMTSRFARTLPGVAFRLGGRVDTHVTGLTASGGAVSLTRWFYRQRMEGTLQRAQRPWVILVDPGSQPAWNGASGTAAVEPVPVVLGDGPLRTTVVGIEAPASEQQTIRPDADLLFVAGAGWTKKQADGKAHADDAETLILGFLEKTRASLGSSKSLVDLSGEGQDILKFMSHMNQIGQTGATPRHPKGLATCCHGEEPHVVGWRFITERRAINTDPNCGWARGKADVLYVADAFAVIRKVNELLG
jgi:electron transfer flavoprotein alpha subunit